MKNSPAGRVLAWSLTAALGLADAAGCSPSDGSGPVAGQVAGHDGSSGSAAGTAGEMGATTGGSGGGSGLASTGGAPGPAATGGVGQAVGTGGAHAPGTGGADVQGTGGGSASGTGGGQSRGTGGGTSRGTGGAGGIAATGGAAGMAMGGSGGAAPPGSIPIFLAGGYRGRTTISCDDGLSWVANHSDDDSVCPNHDCGEVFDTITGVTYGDGTFFISRGWGMPGNVLRSQDGVVFTQVYSGKQFGGVAYGSGTLVIGSGWQTAWYSTNAGQTVTGAQDFSGILGANTGTIRNVSYHPFGGGRFILIPDDGAGARKFVVSKDLGKTYALGTTADDMCASRVTDVVSGGDVIVGISDETGYACRSLDGGSTWTGKQISAAGLSRQLVWTGSEFMAYGGGAGYRSTDGDTWTKFTLSPTGLRFGALARSSMTGTIVAGSPYGSDYGAQSFYRSIDGITWQALAAGKFVGSHLIEHMSFGFGQHSAACP